MKIAINNSASLKASKALCYIPPVLIVLVTFYVRFRLLDVPLERDEGEFAYMGQLMLKGFPPFSAAYSMKLPGIYGAYALIIMLFGQTARAIHLGLLLVSLMNTILIFLLARKIFDSWVGMVAAAVFSLFAVSQGFLGVFAHATHFVVLFYLLGFVLLFLTIESRKSILALLSGVMFGLSFTMKQHAAPIIAFGFFWLLYSSIRREAGLKHIITETLLFSAGVIIPFGIWCLYLAEKGVFEKFWFWTVTYATEYVKIQTIDEGKYWFMRQVPKIVETTWPIWLFAGAGLLSLIRPGEGRDRKVFLMGLLVSSCAAVIPGYYFRPHYFVMLLPVVSILVAVAVTLPFCSREIGFSPLRQIAALAAIVAIGLTIFFERGYLFKYSPLEVSRVKYWDSPFPESIDVAEFLKANTSSTDRIAVFGSEPQIYFYADRISATPHIYMYGLMEEQPFARKMQEEIIRDIEATRPKYIVDVTQGGSWVVHPRSEKMIFAWENVYLNRYYERVGLFDIIYPRGNTIQVWGNDLLKYKAKSWSQIVIYRRK